MGGSSGPSSTSSASTEWSRADTRRLNELARRFPSREHTDIKARCKLIAAEMPERTAKDVARKLRSTQASRSKNRKADATMQKGAKALAAGSSGVSFAQLRARVDEWTVAESVRYTHDVDAAVDQVERLTRSIVDSFGAMGSDALAPDEMKAFAAVLGNRWLVTRARTLHKLGRRMSEKGGVVGAKELRAFARADLFPDSARSAKVSDEQLDAMLAAAGSGGDGVDTSLAEAVAVMGRLRARAAADGANSGRRGGRRGSGSGTAASGRKRSTPGSALKRARRRNSKTLGFTPQMRALLGALGDARVPPHIVAKGAEQLSSTLSSAVEKELQREYSRQLTAAIDVGSDGMVSVVDLNALLNALETKQRVRGQRRVLRKLIAAIEKEGGDPERPMPFAEVVAFTPRGMAQSDVRSCLGDAGEGGEMTLLAMRRRLVDLNTSALQARRLTPRKSKPAHVPAPALEATSAGAGAPAPAHDALERHETVLWEHGDEAAETEEDAAMEIALQAEEVVAEEAAIHHGRASTFIRDADAEHGAAAEDETIQDAAASTADAGMLDPLDALLASAQVSTDDDGDDDGGDADGAAAEDATEGALPLLGERGSGGSSDEPNVVMASSAAEAEAEAEADIKTEASALPVLDAEAVAVATEEANVDAAEPDAGASSAKRPLVRRLSTSEIENAKAAHEIAQLAHASVRNAEKERQQANAARRRRQSLAGLRARTPGGSSPPTSPRGGFVDAGLTAGFSFDLALLPEEFQKPPTPPMEAAHPSTPPGANNTVPRGVMGAAIGSGDRNSVVRSILRPAAAALQRLNGGGDGGGSGDGDGEARTINQLVGQLGELRAAHETLATSASALVTRCEELDTAGLRNERAFTSMITTARQQLAEREAKIGLIQACFFALNDEATSNANANSLSAGTPTRQGQKQTPLSREMLESLFSAIVEEESGGGALSSASGGGGYGTLVETLAPPPTSPRVRKAVLDDAATTSNATIAALERELDLANVQIENGDVALAAALHDREDAQTRIGTLTSELDAANARCAESDAMLHETLLSLESSAAANDAVHSHRNELEEHIVTLTTRHAAEVEALEASHIDAAAALAAKEAEHGATKATLVAAQQHIAAMRNVVDANDANAKSDAASASATADARVEIIERELAAARAEVVAAHDELHANAVRGADDLKTIKTAMDAKVMQARDELDAARGVAAERHRELEANLSSANAELKALNVSLVSSVADKAMLEKNALYIEAKHASALAAAEEVRLDAARSSAASEHAIVAARTAGHKAVLATDAQLSMAKQQLQAAETALRSQEVLLRAAESALDGHTARVRRVEADLEEARASATLLEENATAQTSALAAAVSELDEVKLARDALQSERDEQSEHALEMSEDLADAHIAVDALTTELSQLRLTVSKTMASSVLARAMAQAVDSAVAQLAPPGTPALSQRRQQSEATTPAELRRVQRDNALQRVAELEALLPKLDATRSVASASVEEARAQTAALSVEVSSARKSYTDQTTPNKHQSTCESSADAVAAVERKLAASDAERAAWDERRAAHTAEQDDRAAAEVEALRDEAEGTRLHAAREVEAHEATAASRLIAAQLSTAESLLRSKQAAAAVLAAEKDRLIAMHARALEASGAEVQAAKDEVAVHDALAEERLQSLLDHEAKVVRDAADREALMVAHEEHALIEAEAHEAEALHTAKLHEAQALSRAKQQAHEELVAQHASLSERHSEELAQVAADALMAEEEAADAEEAHVARVEEEAAHALDLVQKRAALTLKTSEDKARKKAAAIRARASALAAKRAEREDAARIQIEAQHAALLEEHARLDATGAAARVAAIAAASMEVRLNALIEEEKAASAAASMEAAATRAAEKVRYNEIRDDLVAACSLALSDACGRAFDLIDVEMNEVVSVAAVESRYAALEAVWLPLFLRAPRGTSGAHADEISRTAWCDFIEATWREDYTRVCCGGSAGALKISQVFEPAHAVLEDMLSDVCEERENAWQDEREVQAGVVKKLEVSLEQIEQRAIRLQHAREQDADRDAATEAALQTTIEARDAALAVAAEESADIQQRLRTTRDTVVQMRALLTETNVRHRVELSALDANHLTAMAAAKSARDEARQQIVDACAARARALPVPSETEVAALLSELRDHQLARTQSLMSLSDSAASRLDREKKLAVETAASAVVQELRGEIDAMSVEMAEAHNATGKALSRAASVEAQLEVQQHHHTKEIAKLVAKVESAATEEKEIIAARKLLVEKTQQLADAQRREKRVRTFVASFAQLKEEMVRMKATEMKLKEAVHVASLAQTLAEARMGDANAETERLRAKLESGLPSAMLLQNAPDEQLKRALKERFDAAELLEELRLAMPKADPATLRPLLQEAGLVPWEELEVLRNEFAELAAAASAFRQSVLTSPPSGMSMMMSPEGKTGGGGLSPDRPAGAGLRLAAALSAAVDGLDVATIGALLKDVGFVPASEAEILQVEMEEMRLTQKRSRTARMQPMSMRSMCLKYLGDRWLNEQGEREARGRGVRSLVASTTYSPMQRMVDTKLALQQRVDILATENGDLRDDLAKGAASMNATIQSIVTQVEKTMELEFVEERGKYREQLNHLKQRNTMLHAALASGATEEAARLIDIERSRFGSAVAPGSAVELVRPASAPPLTDLMQLQEILKLIKQARREIDQERGSIGASPRLLDDASAQLHKAMEAVVVAAASSSLAAAAGGQRAPQY